MAAELGKSGYEGEKDIAAQEEIYAAFLALMMELLKIIPGFSPRIDIQKGQGLTIERKPPGQAIEDVVEVEQKPLPDALQNEPAKKPGIQTLYGVGQNNLTPNDIKAISAIIAGKQGDTVIGGEGLIIKYNGKTLFETDERGKISLHTAVSPQMREKFAALQAGLATPTPLPAMGVPKVPEEKQAITTNTDATPQLANNILLPPNFKTEERRVAEQEPTSKAPDNIVTKQLTTEVPEKQTLSINMATASLPESVVESSEFDLTPPTFSTKEKQAAINQDPASEELDDIPVPKFRLWGEENNALNQSEQLNIEPVHGHDDVPAIGLPPDAVVEEQIVEYAGESLSGIEQVEPTEPMVVSKKSILENVGNYVVDRGKKDTQVTFNAVSQMASTFGTIFAANLAQGLQAIPEQYSLVKARLTNNVMAEDDPKLEASISTYMDQVDDMFDELKQDDPKLGLSADHVMDGTIEPINIEVEEPDLEEIDEPEPDIGKAERDFEKREQYLEEQYSDYDPIEVVNQSPDMGDDNTQSVAIENPDQLQVPKISKPAKLQAVSIEDALRYMSRRDDGAKAQDGKGYNLNDTGIGKRLKTQIDRDQPLDSVQAKDAMTMLKKYHKQFAEGGIKLPSWKAVQTQYSEPAYSATDQRAIFARQQEKLDTTMPIGQQEAILKAVYKVHTLNIPEQNYPIQSGRYELGLPTGSMLVNEIDDLGVNNLSIEKNGESILLGGVAMPGNYMPASTLPNAMPELRQLRTFLTGDLKLSSEPVKAIPLNQPLPINKNDASESLEPKTDAEEKPYTITPKEKPYTITPREKPEALEPAKQPAISRGGR